MARLFKNWSLRKALGLPHECFPTSMELIPGVPNPETLFWKTTAKALLEAAMKGEKHLKITFKSDGPAQIKTFSTERMMVKLRCGDYHFSEGRVGKNKLFIKEGNKYLTNIFISVEVFGENKKTHQRFSVCDDYLKKDNKNPLVQAVLQIIAFEEEIRIQKEKYEKMHRYVDAVAILNNVPEKQQQEETKKQGAICEEPILLSPVPINRQ